MTEDRQTATSDRARERYSDGANCAQSVIDALSDTAGMPALPAGIGAGHTSGIGGAGCICGALAAGVAMLGEYANAQELEPAATRALAEGLSAELHSRFVARFGSACCRVIKRGQTEGSDVWLSTCASLTEETARMVADIVAEDAAGIDGRARWAARDLLSTGRRAALGGLAGAAIAAASAAAVAPQARAAVFAAVTAVLVASALGLELGGAGPRRAGRVLRTLGALSGAALAVGALVAPAATGELATALLAPGPWSLVGARALVALCALVAAGASAFALKRYR